MNNGSPSAINPDSTDARRPGGSVGRKRLIGEKGEWIMKDMWKICSVGGSELSREAQ